MGIHDCCKANLMCLCVYVFIFLCFYVLCVLPLAVNTNCSLRTNKVEG